MHLARLACHGIRNLVDVDVAPHPRLNVFVGDNGQGKTNLLEVIHLAASLRPLKPLERQSELLRHAADLPGAEAATGVVRATFQAEAPIPVEVVIEAKGKRATVAGKAVRDASELWRLVGVVSFLPDDNAMVRGSPELRRRALDRVAFSLDAGFAAVARRFEEALERRNRVLKAPHVDTAQLESYDAPFADAAVALTSARARAAATLGPSFAAEARGIGGDALAATLRYASAIDGSDGSGPLGDGDAGLGDDASARVSRLLELLGAARDQELRRRTTAVGPHHDDVVLLHADRRARFLASQGEARALVLAWKLAQVRLVTAARGAGPLLLLDDVAGELDPARARRLFAAADESGAQVFVTATHLDALPTEVTAAGRAAVFDVQAGRVEAA